MARGETPFNAPNVFDRKGQSAIANRVRIETQLAKARDIRRRDSLSPQPPESTESKIPSVLGKIGRATVAAELAATAVVGQAAAEPTLTASPTPKPGFSETLPANFATPTKIYNEQVIRTPTPTATPKLETQEVKAASFEDDIAPVRVTREWLEQNPQDIKATATRQDANGNEVQEFVVLDNKILYERHKDSSGKLTEYKAVSQVAMGNTLALSVSSDGQVIVVAGEDPIRSGETKITVSYDAGKTWKNIPWPYELSGGTIDLLRFTDSNFLGNNGNYEGGKSQYALAVNRGTQSASVKPASFETITAANFNVGSAGDLRLASVNTSANQAEMRANGSSQLQQGILLFKNFDYVTSSGTVEHITTTITMDGAPNYNLGYLSGSAEYTDSLGHVHFVASNTDRQLLFDIDLSTRTGTSQNYANLLDNKGIPNYMNGRLKIFAADVIIDTEGNKHTWLGGAYPSTIEGTGRAIFFNLETLSYYDLEPNQSSDILSQKSMQRKKINGQLGYELSIYGLGKAFVPINSDGSPKQDAQIYYLNKGLGSALQNENTPTPTPSPSPSRWRVMLPVSLSNVVSGWRRIRRKTEGEKDSLINRLTEGIKG